MNDRTLLPEDYRELLKIDLQKDKKLALLINGLSLAMAILLIIPAACLVPLSTLLESTLSTYWIKLILFLVGTIVYMVLHELVHGLFMRGFSGVRPHYGFTGLYAYAGSTAYFTKKEYIIIALSPIVIWGVVLAVILLLVPAAWFWPVYMIEVINISGAAGDLYVTCRFARLPKDILIGDTGVAMTVYGRSTPANPAA